MKFIATKIPKKKMLKNLLLMYFEYQNQYYYWNYFLWIFSVL